MSKEGRFYLACPYAEKDEAKSLGARWDAGAKKWYVPDDVDKDLFEKWWPTSSGEEDVTDVAPFPARG